MKTSGFLKLDWNDLGKGLLMAILTPVIGVIYQTVQAGSLTFDWHMIEVAAVGGFIAYMTKNFFTPASIVTPAPTNK